MGYIEYSEDGRTLISASGIEGYFVVPDGVTEIFERAFWCCSSLTDIEIPNSVTKIGNYAFWDCSSLTNIIIPNSVTEIGERAFGYCSSLTNIEIPNSVTKIDSFAFSGCSQLKDPIIVNEMFVRLPEDYEGKYSIPFGIKVICGGAFSGCKSLTNIEIPNSVMEICDGAFYGCSQLKAPIIVNQMFANLREDYKGKYSIPFGIKIICAGAFSGCKSLTNVEIPNSVTKIGERAFEDCSSLTNIEIPNSVTKIGEATFWGCSSLTNIEIPNSVTKIGEATFWECSSLANIKIPNSVTEIGESAFSGCSLLTSVEIPNSVSKIGRNAFYDCSSLTNIEIPNSVTKIGEDAFAECSSLTKIEIPNSVTKIGERAFENCSSLTDIEIPNSVTEIGERIFDGCSSLASIEIPKSITNIPRFCLHGTKLRNIFIHKEVMTIGEHAFCNSPIEYYEVEKGNPNYTSKGGVLLNKAETMIIKFPSKKGVDSYQIPESIESLSDWAFKGSLLQTIIFCDGLNSLGWEQTFACCKRLETITIPNGIREIPSFCFSEDISLSEVKLPDTIRIIGFKVFKNCVELTKLHLRVENPSLIFITDHAFEDFPFDQCTLYVPIGTGYAYRHHPVFGKFKDVKIER